MGITLRLMVDTIHLSYQFNYCFIIYQLCLNYNNPTISWEDILYSISPSIRHKSGEPNSAINHIISMHTHSIPTRSHQVDCHLYKEKGGGFSGLNSGYNLQYWHIHSCVHIGPRSPFSSTIFTSAYDAISVVITHGSNDETDIYNVKKEYPCRGELKPLLSKVMASFLGLLKMHRSAHRM